MTRTAAAIVVITISTVATAHAELKIVSRTSIKPAATTAAPADPDPMLAMFGEMTLQLMAPDGPVELTAIVGEKAARIEYAQATLGFEAGTVMLIQPNTDFAVLNPKKKTYWKTTADDAANMWKQLESQPRLTHKRTGEFSTVAGLRAERVTFEWSMEFSGASGPMKLTGELWIAADRYQQYAALAVRTNTSLAPFGMTSLLKEGVVLRSILRSPTFGGKEIETVVASIGEITAPASTFTIPASYKLVPAPGGQ